MTKGDLRAVTIVHFDTLLALFHESGRNEVKMAALFVVKKKLLQQRRRNRKALSLCWITVFLTFFSFQDGLNLN